MIIASGEVSPSIAVDAKKRLEQAGAHILGVVLNKVDVAANSHYGYGYYYYYGKEDNSSRGGDK